MAYAVAYMRSILGSIPFLVKLYTLFLCRGIFFWLPIPPPPLPPCILHADDPFLRASVGFCDTLIF